MTPPSLAQIKAAVPHGVYLTDRPWSPWFIAPDEHPSVFADRRILKRLSPDAIHAALSEPWRECEKCDGVGHFPAAGLGQHPHMGLGNGAPCPTCNGTGKLDQHKELRAFIEGLVA